MRVKLLKDLLGCKAGTYELDEYGSFVWETTPDVGLIRFNAKEIKANPDLFEILPELKFKVSDWVWDEDELLPKKAVDEKVEYSQHKHYIEYINAHPKRFKRFATEEEIGAVTEKEDNLLYGQDCAGNNLNREKIKIVHDRVYSPHLLGSYILISELRRIIEIADKLLIR